MADEQIQDDVTKNIRVAKMEDICEEIEEKYENKIKEIKAEIEEMKPIDDSRLSEELTRVISRFQTYITRKEEEKMTLARIEKKKDDIHGELYGKYKKNSQVRFDSKGEVDEWINRDPKWLKIITHYENQKIICQYYQGIIDFLIQKQWCIKYKIDIVKNNLGLN
jgi:hypothetical protein